AAPPRIRAPQDGSGPAKPSPGNTTASAGLSLLRRQKTLGSIGNIGAYSAPGTLCTISLVRSLAPYVPISTCASLGTPLSPIASTSVSRPRGVQYESRPTPLGRRGRI